MIRKFQLRPVQFLLVLYFAFGCFSTLGQAQAVQWIQQFGTPRDEGGNAIARVSSGEFVAGQTIGVFPNQTSTGLNDRDAFVARYDSDGNQLWVRQFGSTSPAGDSAQGAAADASGVYVAGFTNGTLPLQTRIGNQDGFVRKYDANGTELWTRQFGTTSDDEANAVAVNDGGVYVVGTVFCCGAALPTFPTTGGTDAYIRKYDTNGNELWTRQFGTGDIEEGRGVALDASGVYVVGITTGALAGPQGGRDGFLRKYDFNGNLLWTKQFGSNRPETTNVTDDAFAVAVGAGGVFVSGASAQGSFPGQTFAGGLWDAYLIKFDSSGNQQWVRQFGTDADEYGFAVAVGTSSVMVGGQTGGAFPGQTYTANGDAFLRLYDFDGNHLGTREFGSPGGSVDTVTGIVSDVSGYYVGGEKGGDALNTIPLGGQDAFLLKALPPPDVPNGGVVNAASFAPSPAPLAPGSIAVIFGTYLNEGSTVLSTSFGEDGKLITSLGGTQVRVNNIPAPLFYSTPNQVAVQIPFEVAGQSTATLAVTVAGVSSTARTINIAPAAPGFFTVNQGGSGTAIVLHSDGATLVTADNPARPNEVVIFYLTGLGALSSPLGTGVPAGGNPAAAAATMSIGGTPAVIDYAGAAPGFVGLNQINAHIPAGVAAGSSVPVQLTVGGRQANAVTIPIGQ